MIRVTNLITITGGSRTSGILTVDATPSNVSGVNHSSHAARGSSGHRALPPALASEQEYNNKSSFVVCWGTPPSELRKEGASPLFLSVFSGSIRAKAEHPFFYVKRMFGDGKVRYRWAAQRTPRRIVLLGFINLLIAERVWRRDCGARAPGGRAKRRRRRREGQKPGRSLAAWHGSAAETTSWPLLVADRRVVQTFPSVWEVQVVPIVRKLSCPR